MLRVLFVSRIPILVTFEEPKTSPTRRRHLQVWLVVDPRTPALIYSKSWQKAMHRQCILGRNGPGSGGRDSRPLGWGYPPTVEGLVADWLCFLVLMIVVAVAV